MGGGQFLIHTFLYWNQMNRISISDSSEPFLTIVYSFENSEHQLFDEYKIVKKGSVEINISFFDDAIFAFCGKFSLPGLIFVMLFRRRKIVFWGYVLLRVPLARARPLATRRVLRPRNTQKMGATGQAAETI